MKKIILLAVCATLLATACQKAKDILTVKAFFSANAFTELNCDSWTGSHSDNSFDSVNVTFTNNSQRLLHVNWIDYNGQEQTWFDLANGTSHDVPTFKTHVWIIRKTDGACSTVLKIKQGSTTHETVSFGEQ
jgi:hypothetical protein